MEFGISHFPKFGKLVRILLTTFGFYPAVAWGGPVKVVSQDAQELLRRGHSVTICCSNLLNKKEYIKRGTFVRFREGVKVVYLDTYAAPRWHGTVGPTFMSPGSLIRLFREVRNADVVHANGTRNIVVLSSAFFARVLKKPFILQPHGTLPHILGSIQLKRLFDSIFGCILIGRASALIALQEKEQRDILQAGGDPARIYVVPNGLSSENGELQAYCGQFKARFQIPQNDRVILFLGRINRKKGADLLVEAFARLAHRQHTHLVIAGPDDGHLEEVQSLVKKLGVSQQTIFPGLLSGEDILRAYAGADVFVLPCRTDTFPMTLLEACQSGTPIIVTETCEIADKIDGIAGTAVPFNAKVMAKALNAMLTDEAQRAKYSAGGRRLVETEFSLKLVGDKLERIYMDVVNPTTPIFKYPR